MRRLSLGILGLSLIALPALASQQNQIRSDPKSDHVSHSKKGLPTASWLEARGGCGSKGGPGWRKSNGQCASWKD